MIIHPRVSAQTVINSGSVFEKIDPKQWQPNAVDLTLHRVFRMPRISGTNRIQLSEKVKNHALKEEVFPTGLIGEEHEVEPAFALDVGTYEILFNETVIVGAAEAGWVITRSTLNRNGVFITSGLYDSGYNGVMAAALHVTTVPLWIAPNTRIAQYVTASAESFSQYAGDYGHGTAHDTAAYGKANESLPH